MAKQDNERILKSLGTFFDLFPKEEREYLYSYWDAKSDAAADLWMYAFQLNSSKDIFSTNHYFERLNTLVNISNLVKTKSVQFELSSVIDSGQSGLTIRGFIPRESMRYKASDIPQRGIIRIGPDSINYISANVISDVGGKLDGYVREATFTLEGTSVPHDYSDTIDLSESFFIDEVEMKFRVSQVAGATFVDAVAESVGIPVDPTGLLILGQPGLNAERHEYQSVTIIGDRYIFAFPPTWQDNQGSAPDLSFAHVIDEPLTVRRLRPTRWSIATSGAARVHADNAAVMTVDNEPNPVGVSSARISDALEIEANVDFDVSVTVFLDKFEAVSSSEKRSGVTIRVGGKTCTVHLRRSAAGLFYVAGEVGSEISISAPLLSKAELRLARTGNTLELTVRPDDSPSFQRIAIVSVTGERSSLAMFIEDDGTDTHSVVRFDEVVRRRGRAAGSTRLEERFVVDDRFPYRYDIDVDLLYASSLIDYARPRTNKMTVSREFDGTSQYLYLRADAGQLPPAGVGINDAGVVTIGGVDIVYNSYLRLSATELELLIRTPVDYDILPVQTGASATVSTREIRGQAFKIPEPGKLWLRDAPTRDKMWAPRAHEDLRHVQSMYGPLTGFTQENSSAGYLGRVQGTWFALTSGPAIENIRTGVHMAIGLPAARFAGVVSEIGKEYNDLGVILARYLIISSGTTKTKYYIDPSMYGVDWSVSIGQSVSAFEPLTNGVEVYDTDTDNDWPALFNMDPLSPERFNAFGVFVDTQSINSESSIVDALIFALKAKPNIAKLIFRMISKEGSEDIKIEDGGEIASVATLCDHLAFEYGDPGPDLPLKLDSGHKLDQGKKLDSNSIFSSYPKLDIGLHLDAGLTLDMDKVSDLCGSDFKLSYESLEYIAVVEVDGGGG